MTPVNPCVVRLPDNSVGVLVARLGLQGCIQVGQARVLRTVRLDNLDYHLTRVPRDSKS